MNFAIVVVLIKVDSNVPASGPISAEKVIGFEHSLEMCDMFTSNIVHTKIVDNEGDPYWSPFLHPQAWDQFTLLITMFVEVLFKELVCD